MTPSRELNVYTVREAGFKNESKKKKKNEVRAASVFFFSFACWSLIFHCPDWACRLDPAWLYTKLIPAAPYYLLLQYAAFSWTFLHYLSFYSQERETFEEPPEITHRPSSPSHGSLHSLSLTNTQMHTHAQSLYQSWIFLHLTFLICTWLSCSITLQIQPFTVDQEPVPH